MHFSKKLYLIFFNEQVITNEIGHLIIYNFDCRNSLNFIIFFTHIFNVNMFYCFLVFYVFYVLHHYKMML